MFHWIRNWRLFSGGDLTQARFLIVGLGNPGDAYAWTRHNAGFMVADQIAARYGVCRWRRTGGAEVRRCEAEGVGVFAVAKPQRFMNRSGGPAGTVLRQCPGVEQCLVAVDDVNLPLGAIRIRRGGSDGGHNGLKSMIAALGNHFPRVRVGVGPVAAGESLVDYVLGPFAEHERQALAAAVHRAADALLCAMSRGVDTAMSQYNG